MKLKITQKDIENGIPGSAESCPVALAFKRECPECSQVRVLGSCVEYVEDGKHETNLITEDGAMWVWEYDTSGWAKETVIQLI